MTDDPETTDEILGIVRCARCGHRLEGEIECPFCSLFPDKPRSRTLPKWVYITACFLSSPFSIYFVAKSSLLTPSEKILSISGCLVWFGVYFLIS